MSRLSLDMTKWLPRHAGQDRLGVNLIQSRLLLRLRLDHKSNRGFSRRRSIRLVLQVGTAFVKRSDDGKYHCSTQHYPNEKHEVAGPLQLHCAVGILDEEIDRSGELVAERDREQISAHDKRFEFDRPLGVGELEVRGRNQRFACGQNHECPDLPNYARSLAGVYARLNHGDEKK